MRYRIIGPLRNGDYQVWDSCTDQCIATFHNPAGIPDMLTAKYYANKYATEQNRIDQGRMVQVGPLLAGIDETVASVEARLSYWVNR